MKSSKTKGQALLETIFIVPVLIFIILFSLQIFRAIYQSQIMQEKAKQELLGHFFDHAANGGINMKSLEIVSKTSQGIETSGLPILGTQRTQPLSIRIGICRDTNCKQ